MIVVILTATVRPNTTVRVSLVEPELRLSQYRIALAEWAAQAVEVGFQILLVETSGAPLDTLLAPQMAKTVWFHNYDPPATVVARGKGAIEWNAVGAAIDAFRARLKPDDTLYKATGRIGLTNPQAVIVPLGAEEVRLRKRIDGHLCDTRLLGAPVALWDRVLLPAESNVDLAREVDIEHAVASAVQHMAALKKVEWSRFPVRPLFRGESGFNGKKYSPRRTQFKQSLIRPIETIITYASSRVGH